MIPTPIRQVLSTIRTNGVQALLMGGQACVFYGAAQVSKDIDLILLADSVNFERLQKALAALNARRIAVPPFKPELLERGHAVHFRCAASGVEDLRIDVMTRLRDLPPFDMLWQRRTVITDEAAEEFNLLSIPDLVTAKKTQRMKDWPVIELLVAIHYRENGKEARADWIQFWLCQARTPELLEELVQRFAEQARIEAELRPLLRLATPAQRDALREALDAEVRAEQAKDREYWAPLRAEMEAFRRADLRRGEEP